MAQSIIVGIVFFALAALAIRLVYTKLMVPNGDGNMPADLVNSVKSDVTDIAPKL